MKNFLLTLCVMIPFGVVAQVQSPDAANIESDENVRLEMVDKADAVKETKKERKEREKKMRELNEDISYAKASNSMRRGYFVLLANSVDMGRRFTGLNEAANFILVQGEDGIIQFAFNTYHPGPNGLGGWTNKGIVRGKRIKYNDNGDVHLEYQLVSNKEIASVYITLYHNSNSAVAHISGAINMTVYGEIRPYRDKDHRN